MPRAPTLSLRPSSSVPDLAADFAGLALPLHYASLAPTGPPRQRTLDTPPPHPASKPDVDGATAALGTLALGAPRRVPRDPRLVGPYPRPQRAASAGAPPARAPATTRRTLPPAECLHRTAAHSPSTSRRATTRSRRSSSLGRGQIITLALAPGAEAASVVDRHVVREAAEGRLAAVVVSAEWVRHCAELGRLLPVDGYAVRLPAFRAPQGDL
ncbi:hypothetical protein Q8F55_005829 [Vanrija albida]|uniref:BRCT domain-containing protein n=1 Tax=Vanrija albida TaxID=181172 RepID=A0ABR3Q2N1_9TREE